VKRPAAFLLFCLLAAAQGPTEPTGQPPVTPEALAAGERIFRTQCAYCHGDRGEGGRGPSLAHPRLVRAPDDLALFNVIARGIPESEMPGFWLTAREIWQVVAFVRTLGQVPVEKISGDPVRGEKLYAKGGCARCHTIAGRGGAIGPDLTDIGKRRSTAYLRDALANPEAAVPVGFLMVRVASQSGYRGAGVRLNEDAFSIQIRDLSDKFHSFWKSELLDLKKEPGKSPMPGYRAVFTPSEIDDVIVYLQSLDGAR